MVIEALGEQRFGKVPEVVDKPAFLLDDGVDHVAAGDDPDQLTAEA
jgi:hypothetical protein